MAAQHKRPGKKAKKERQRNIEKKARNQQRVVVHFPKRWDPEYICTISPGRCMAWADGRLYKGFDNNSWMEG